ncbi:MAG: methyl-accepting chemotaxis protein [Aquabacterium sp.]
MSWMMQMRRFTIRTRMRGAIAVVMLLLAAVGGAGLYGMVYTQDALDQFRHHAYEEQRSLTLVSQQLAQLRRHESTMLLHAGQAALVNGALEKWSRSLEALREAAGKMQAGESDADNAAVNDLVSAVQRYEATVKQVAPKLVAGGLAAEEVTQTFGAVLEQAAAIDEQAARLATALESEAAEVAEAQQALTEKTRLVFGLAVLAALLVVAPTTILNEHAITAPLAQAVSVADGIAAGKLHQAIPTDGGDETAALMRALQSMQAALRAMVAEVRSSADSISVASSQIASGNMDLSSRTENTASSLQETASSVEELTANVRQSAEAAGMANELAQGAARAAERGGQIVGEVVTNMGAIDATSRRINDIIGVIDGIAFQTNILALNAAVEAARAGEQGRGFAVVAAEVRSLAQRSATAAREIKQLITTSGETVASGTRLVEEAGAAMQEIQTSVRKVFETITEISRAASEQSTGIGQVNQAVAGLDQMTQQNAALVEESAAAASSLEEQAQKLTRSMATFQI